MFFSVDIIQRIYWCFAVTRWRIWAFENVRNVHELKTKAIKASLIWPDGSFFERTEIKTTDDKYKLSHLESKFEQPDVFFDDLK